MKGMLTLSLSDDKISAFIHGDLAGVEPSEAEARIRRLLTSHDVTFGVSEDSVHSASHALSRTGKLPPTLLAMGELPSPGKLPGAFFDIPVYEEVRFPPEIRAQHKAVPYYLLLEYVRDPYIVREGEVIGRILDGEPPKAGIDVTGADYFPATPSGPEQGMIELGEGLSIEGREKRIVAGKQGVILKKKNIGYLLAVNPNAGINLEVSQDRLTATVSLLAASLGGKLPAFENVTDALDRKGIHYELPQTELEEALRRFRMSPSESIKDIVVAQGTEPSRGEDGWVEFLVDLSFSHRPSIREDGRADYYSVHTYEAVKKDQPLVRIHAPGTGESGRDVYGAVLEGTKGKPVQFKAGRMVQRSPRDPLTLLSSINGHAYLRHGKLEVEEVFRVRSDVDFRTGNIHFPGDVVIDGDVKGGFGVRAAGNIYVKGAVEDAVIESRQNVIIYSGFVGSGKGVVRADGDVVISFVRNQCVRARDSIMVSGEVVDARFSAGNAVLVESAKSCVIGGEISARRLIRVHTLGNESAVTTRVRTGVDFIVEMRMGRITAEEKKLKNEREALGRTIHQLSYEESRGGLSSEKSMTRAQVSIMADSIDRRLGILAEQKKGLREHLYIRKSQVQVIGEVYENVVVTVATQAHPVREHRGRCAFYLSGGKVHCE